MKHFFSPKAKNNMNGCHYVTETASSWRNGYTLEAGVNEFRAELSACKPFSEIDFTHGWEVGHGGVQAENGLSSEGKKGKVTNQKRANDSKVSSMILVHVW